MGSDGRNDLFNNDMKTKEQVKREIDRLMAIGNKATDAVEKNRIRKRLQFLRSIAIYMEHSPSITFVESQLELCHKKMEVIHREFEHRYPSYCDAKAKREFMKGKGLPELKKQVEALKYILQ